MNEIPYNQTDHYHCWEYPIPPCGQKIEHLKCCLCEKLNPKAMSESNKCPKCNKRIYQRGQTYTPGDECTCMSESNKQKIEVGAKDFANRFLPVMKELAEEEAITPSWEAELQGVISKAVHYYKGKPVSISHTPFKAFIQSLLDRQREELAPRSLYRNRVTITIKIADDKNQEVIQVIRGLDEITCSSEQVVPILLEDTLQKIVSESKILTDYQQKIKSLNS